LIVAKTKKFLAKQQIDILQWLWWWQFLRRKLGSNKHNKICFVLASMQHTTVKLKINLGIEKRNKFWPNFFSFLCHFKLIYHSPWHYLGLCKGQGSLLYMYIRIHEHSHGWKNNWKMHHEKFFILTSIIEEATLCYH
jgi:hypothetical protein